MTLTAAINPMVPLNLLFPHQRVIYPQSRQSAKYRIVTHNFTNDDLTNVNILAISLTISYFINDIFGHLMVCLSASFHTSKNNVYIFF